MEKNIILALLLISLTTLTFTEGNPVSKVGAFKETASSIKKPNPALFSYLDAMARKDGKAFSYNKHKLINGLKKDGVTFSYSDAIKNYVQSKKRASLGSLKSKVADFLKVLDLVKTEINRPIKISKYIKIRRWNDIQKNQDKKPDIVTAKPVTTTTAEQQTEEPDSEQVAANVSGPSRCYCMQMCPMNLTPEGECGKPDVTGKRWMKCCKSTEAGSAEENETE